MTNVSSKETFTTEVVREIKPGEKTTQRFLNNCQLLSKYLSVNIL
jgi:hypothetical protein